jgi:hypothetical protein
MNVPRPISREDGRMREIEWKYGWGEKNRRDKEWMYFFFIFVLIPFQSEA